MLYTGMLLVSNTAVLCIICLHKCSEDGKNNQTEYGRENMFDLSQQLCAKMFIILVPNRICVMLPRLSYSFNMLLPFISASDVQELH